MTSAPPIVRLENVAKAYRVGSEEVAALQRVSLDVDEGDFVALMGPSGSGKTTLLQIIGGLMTPDEGRVVIAGREISALGDGSLSRFRNRTVGFVFQFFHLQPYYTALENVALPLYFTNLSRDERRERAREALGSVGLLERAEHRPDQLSGGEMQRVAIARAVVNHPKLLLADEPTGNLDRASGENVLGLIEGIHRDRGMTVVMVTHDEQVGGRARRMLQMDGGRLVA